MPSKGDQTAIKWIANDPSEKNRNISYKELEKLGFTLPVVNLNISYKKPAFYDDVLTIRTTIKEMPYIACSHNRLSNIAANSDEQVAVSDPGTHLNTILI